VFGSDNDPGCLLPVPSKSMAMPLISLDFDKATNLVLRTATIDPSAVRMKPLISTVTGVGYFKSRMLEDAGGGPTEAALLRDTRLRAADRCHLHLLF
jgi:hypothetical protein